MSRLFQSLCCICVAFIAGCGNDEETLSNAPLAPEANAESQQDAPDSGENTADDDRGQNSSADATVYPIEQLVKDVRSGKREVSFMTVVDAGDPIKVRGVIAEVDPYQTDLIEETAKPTVKLESGVLDLASMGADSDILIDCVFSDQEELDGLKTGQTIELSGYVTWAFSFSGPKSFKLERCELLKAEPAEIASPPFYSFETSTKDYGDESEKLQGLLTRLNDAGISSFSSSFTQNMFYNIGISNSVAGDDGHLPKEIIQLLNEIPMIAKLELESYGAISDTIALDLKHVRYCAELDVSAEKLSGAGLDSLLQIPGVTSLRLNKPLMLKPEDFEALQHVPLLRRLAISGSYDEPTFDGKGDEVLARFKYTPGLRNLRLWSLPITDDGLSVLAKLPDLRSLNMSQCDITGSGLKHLEGAERFWALRLEGEAINDDLADSLAGLKELVILEMNCPAVTSGIGSAFPNLQNLQVLSIMKAQLDDSFADSLAQLPALERLTLSYVEISDDFKLPVAALPHLTRVTLEETGIGGNVCETLGKCPELEYIDISDTDVNDDAIARLVKSAVQSKLERIDLNDTQVTEQSLVELAKLSSLNSIIVSDKLKVSDETKNMLKDAEIRLDVRQSF